MRKFSQFGLNKFLFNAIEDLKLDRSTPIQDLSFNVIKSGRDVLGIAQTGTGKTFAYGVPIVDDLKFSKQAAPRVLVIVPTRELVEQVKDNFNSLCTYLNLRIKGVYGGANINTQRQDVAQGVDVLVATPGRLYDLALDHSVSLKSIQKLVIDEVDVMLDLGFRFQLNNIFELLPERRQNILFSATMTEEVEELIGHHFFDPEKISVALSGTPLQNIEQTAYPVKNFYTKINLLKFLVKRNEDMKKVLVFMDTKANADLLFEVLGESGWGSKIGVVHSNKSQNQRLNAIADFDAGKIRMLITTDVMARGIDLDAISHVVNFDTPAYPENYIHRIGRTGRANKKGKSLLFFTEKEKESKQGIETLMGKEVTLIPFPEEVPLSHQVAPCERSGDIKAGVSHKLKIGKEKGPAFHDKKEKNQKVQLEKSHIRKKKEKYKKPITRGDKQTAQKKRKK